MTALPRLLALTLAIGCVVSPLAASAQNLLTNGDIETLPATPPEFPGWSLSETVTGLPGQFINSAEAVGFANNPSGTPDEFGLWLRAFAGNTEEGLVNERINADLTQTVPGTPGETYTFSGEAAYEGNYSGGVMFLDLLSPSGEIPSPTTNTFELSFLDSGGGVISSFSENVSANVFTGFGYQPITPVTAVAPAGTAEVRVSARAEDMVFNIDPGQSAFYDNFSLTASSDPSTELLTNGDLNAFSPPDPDDIDGFTFLEGPDDTNTLEVVGFANNTPGGARGVWLRSFDEGDGTILADPVSAAEGDEFLFSAFALFEENYSGGDPLQPTQTLLELSFLDGGDSVISTETLDIATVVSNDATFTEISVGGIAPAGTANVQAAVVVTDTISTTGAQSAFFDDFSLVLVSDPGIPGDFDGDGDVDDDDFGVFAGAFGGAGPLGDFDNDGDVDDDDFGVFAGAFGTGTSTAIPEPTAAALAGLAFTALVVRRRGSTVP